MAASITAMRTLQDKASQAEKMIVQMKQQLDQIKRNAVVTACMKEEERYKAENEKLRNEVIVLRQKLVEVETNNGVKQVPLPAKLKSATVVVAAPEMKGPITGSVEVKKVVEAKKQSVQPQIKGKVKEEKPQKNEDKSSGKKESQPKAESKVPAEPASATCDVSKLNMKIGKIVAVEKHPDADSLYVEQVDLGEGRNRVIVSGLVKHVPIEEMQGRLAVFLTNLKPAKMRGILSEGMIMCASCPEKIIIINPPAGAEVGERVTVENYPGEPDELLNPKKKIWETIQPDLKTNEDGYATYKGALWKVDGKGHCLAPSMKNCPIK